MGHIKSSGRGGRLTEEIKFYYEADRLPPPFPTPKLIEVDQNGLLHITRIEGKPLGQHRFFDPQEKDAIMLACAGISKSTASWRSRFRGYKFDYSAALSKAEALGIIEPPTRRALERRLNSFRRVFQHGDFIASNCLVDRNGSVVLVDFEWAGNAYLDGFDEASLLINAWEHPIVRETCIPRMKALPAGLINWVAVLARDMSICVRDGAGEPWAVHATSLYKSQAEVCRRLLSE